MRGIKFRARAIDTKRWVYGNYFTAPLTIENFGTGHLWTPDLKRIHCIDQDGVAFHVDEKSLGQCTGMKDEDGKDIYGGDIMSFQVEMKSNVINGYVVYRNAGFYIAVKDHSKEDKPQYYFLSAVKNSLKVTGTIYENLEKLK